MRKNGCKGPVEAWGPGDCSLGEGDELRVPWGDKLKNGEEPSYPLPPSPIGNWQCKASEAANATLHSNS